MTAAHFLQRLTALATPAEAKKYLRYFRTGPGEYGEGDQFIGVPMGKVFALAKEFIDLPLPEIEKLMESPIHEARAGAMSIMDKQGRRKQTNPAQLKALYDLYLRRIDRINNWDLVDLGAPFVVGRHLFDKPRKPLYKLARSKNLWERRTAIIATLYFVRQGDVRDIFELAELLVNDPEDLLHKGVGGVLRFAGGVDQPRLLAFLDAHAAAMPRTMLRYAIEHLSKTQRAHYLGLKQ